MSSIDWETSQVLGLGEGFVIMTEDGCRVSAWGFFHEEVLFTEKHRQDLWEIQMEVRPDDCMTALTAAFQVTRRHSPSVEASRPVCLTVRVPLGLTLGCSPYVAV